MTYCYDLTKYPKVFEGTYWGSFKKNVNISITDEILVNRNSFVESNNIVKNIISYPRYIDKEFELLNNYIDHKECYITSDRKYILISSPYSNYDKYYNEFDWKPISKLYTDSSYTYMKIIQMKTPVQNKSL